MSIKLHTYLQMRRLANNKSQKEVAERLGHKTPQMVSNWERGQCLPPLNDIKKLCTFIGAKFSEVSEMIIDIKLAETRAKLKEEIR